MTGRRAMALLVGVLLLALLTPSIATAATPRASTTTNTTTPTPRIKPAKKPKLNTWQQAVTDIPKSGIRTKQQALRLFALTFGPVPGVHVKAAKGSEISGTPAINAVLAHLSEYTPAQQRAIQKVLSGDPTAKKIQVEPAPAAAPTSAGDPNRATFVAAPDPTYQQYLAILQQIYPQYVARLGVNLPGTLYLNVKKPASAAAAGEIAASPAYQWNAYVIPDVSTGVYTGCSITANPQAIKAGGTPETFVLAHELFHCFEDYLLGAQVRPDWLIEGGAEYAASVVVNFSSTWWNEYIGLPGKPLFERSYDALGFFAHLAQSGTDPFSVFRAMLLAPTNEVAYAASGAMSAQFVDTWASSFDHQVTRGAAWDLTGPGVPLASAPRPNVTIGDDSTHDEIVDAPAYANALEGAHVDADLLEVKTTGSVRLSDGKLDVVVHGDQQFCTKSGGCACAGSDHTDDPIPIKPDVLVAVSGGTEGAQATVTGLSTTDACCAGTARSTTLQGLAITPVVNCHEIGLHLEKDASLQLGVDYSLLVDHPRIVPKRSRRGKITSLELQGVTGVELSFYEGAAHYQADNARFTGKVPVTVEVPVVPPTRGLPRSMKVTWTIDVRTAIGGDDSTLESDGSYALTGALGPQRGQLGLGQDITTEDSLLDNIHGLDLAPSGIVIAVQTKFAADKGSPTGLKSSSVALTTSSSVTNGSALGSPIALCRGVTLDLLATAGGGAVPTTKATLFQGSQVEPESPICGEQIASVSGLGTK